MSRMVGSDLPESTDLYLNQTPTQTKYFTKIGEGSARQPIIKQELQRNACVVHMLHLGAYAEKPRI